MSFRYKLISFPFFSNFPLNFFLSIFAILCCRWLHHTWCSDVLATDCRAWSFWYGIATVYNFRICNQWRKSMQIIQLLCNTWKEFFFLICLFVVDFRRNWRQERISACHCHSNYAEILDILYFKPIYQAFWLWCCRGCHFG